MRELLLNNTTHFSRHQALLTFSELLANNTTHFYRAYIKQYCYFQRVTSKKYYTLFQSLYQAILTFSEISFRIKLAYLELIQTVFTLSQSYYQTVVNPFLSFNGQSNRWKILRKKIPKPKCEKLGCTQKADNFAINYS